MFLEQNRAVVQHLMAQHRALDALLVDARAAVAAYGGPDADAQPAYIAAVLRRIRGELQRHFAEEEAGGCLEEVVLSCPHLSAAAERIQQEHGELLMRIEELIEHAESPDRMRSAWSEFDRQFDSSYRRMRAHEAAENELLRQGLGAELDVEECGPPPTCDF